MSIDAFDYIIVGGGTAGCILANRLTASGRETVLLLESGGDGRSPWISIPAGFGKLITNPRFNWLFETDPEETTLGRKIPVPRGKGLGGSTLINGMIYVRGQPEDYEDWKNSGADGWGWKDVASYFSRLENYDKGGDGRGIDGPMRVTEVAERFPLAEALLDAARHDGYAMNDDYNGAIQEGFGYYQVTQSNGQRCSALGAYLEPARRRPNLIVRTHAHVLRLSFAGDDRNCTGVVYRQNGKQHTVKARRETILTAGAIQTPQVLELSGIGDPEILEKHGIPVRHRLSGVGNNYIDHYSARLSCRVERGMSLNEMTRGWRLARAVAQYWMKRTGILALGTGLVGGFVRTRPDIARPDVQYFFMHASYGNAATRSLERAPGMTIAASQLRPNSRGSIHIRDSDPLVPPAIRPNCLGQEVDQDTLIAGMKMARRLLERQEISRYIKHEIAPGKDVQTHEEWLGYVRSTGQTIYHPVGTCRMGKGADAVVDNALRLRGIGKVRIADASIMPTMISGNTQAAVMMIAEKAADIISSKAGE